MKKYLITLGTTSLIMSLNWIGGIKLLGIGGYKISISALLLPALGAITAIHPLIISFGFLAIAKTILGGLPITLGIPTAAATLSLATHQSSRAASIVINTLLPLICMALFINNPNGAEAWLYTLYWLIPAGLSLFKYESTLAKAIQATFVAHAVGSVIWIYSTQTTPEFWVGLIPVVAYERIISALVITLSIYASKIAASKLSIIRYAK